MSAKAPTFSPNRVIKEGLGEADPPQPRFCKDCRHVYLWGAPPALCLKSAERNRPNPVSGARNTNACEWERGEGITGCCGPDGKYWEPRPLPWWRRWLRRTA